MKKGQGSMSVNKIIITILVVIVIVVVIFTVFKFDLPQKIKDLLPDYSYPEGKESEISGNDKIVVSKVCPGVQVGKLVVFKNPLFYKLGFSRLKASYILIKSGTGYTQTKLLWIQDGEEKDEINLDRGGYVLYVIPASILPDPKVGKVNSDMKIAIYNQWMTDDDLRKKYSEIPIKSDLELLNGASMMKGNYICK